MWTVVKAAHKGTFIVLSVSSRREDVQCQWESRERRAKPAESKQNGGYKNVSKNQWHRKNRENHWFSST